MWGRELIARQAGRTMPDRAEFVAREAPGHNGHTRRIAALDGITRAEERALRGALGDQYLEHDLLKQVGPLEYSQAGGAMRTLPTPWPGFLASLVTAAECRLSSTRRVAAIRVTYLDDGRRDRAQIDPSTLPGGCEKVLEALARLLLADPEQRLVGQEGEWVLVPMDTSFVECSSHPQNPDAEPIRLSGVGHTLVAMPKKTRDQLPTYPEGVRRERIEGAVLLDGDISTEGCPTALRLVHGVHPGLDWEALTAVSAWRYRSAELNGTPVTVSVTIGVNFKLR
jgi:TonB family protein